MVRVGGTVRVNISVPVNHEPAMTWKAKAMFVVAISYTDVEGQQALETHAHLVTTATSGSHIERMSIYRRGETQPFIRSGETIGEV
jgi:hypothetical protein